jgi:ectoine hydroxylase-related dioxygenase (phytanoyl-CoA dioxygenase family)
MGYVRGSHRDPTRWRPNLFVTRDPVPGTEGADVPDLLDDPRAADVVWIEAGPGDVLVHHARTLHGSGPNTSSTVRRRAISVRYCGAGVTYRARALTPKPHHAGMVDGDALRPPAFPVAWPPEPDGGP